MALSMMKVWILDGLCSSEESVYLVAIVEFLAPSALLTIIVLFTIYLIFNVSKP